LRTFETEKSKQIQQMHNLRQEIQNMKERTKSIKQESPEKITSSRIIEKPYANLRMESVPTIDMPLQKPKLSREASPNINIIEEKKKDEEVKSKILQDLKTSREEYEQDKRNSSKIQDIEYEIATQRERKSYKVPASNNAVKEWEETYANEIFTRILKKGAKYVDSLRGIDIEQLSLKEKANSLEKVFTCLFDEKTREESKYNKLLELHNQLIEVNSKNEQLYSPHKLMEFEDMNGKLRNELKKMQQDYEYFI